MSSAFDRVLERARAVPRRIVLPELADERVQRAAVAIVADNIALPVLLGDRATWRSRFEARGLSVDGIEFVPPQATAAHVDFLVERHEKRGMTTAKARKALNDPLTQACVMVATGEVDGGVAGAVTPTARVVRSARRQIGLADVRAQLSSCFLMLLELHHPVEDAMVIGDCALIIDPDETQLADIATATGDSARELFGLVPEVAMLSFSTAGSARHASVSKVARATMLARKQRPERRIVGEVQLDAAVIPALLARKDPTQATDRPCNVLVFPNLDAGNIGYKLIERFGGARAIGPILQGLARPINDLSRGCSVEDIVSIVAVTAVQAGS